MANPAEPEFMPLESRKVILTHEELDLVKTALPAGARIGSATYFDNYDLPCPVHVEALLVDGCKTAVVLRTARSGDIQIECRVLDRIARCGLPVPTVLAGPVDLLNGKKAAVFSLLPGATLQKLSMRSPECAALASRLLIEAIQSLTSITGDMQSDPVAAELPKRTLAGESAHIFAADNPWLEDPLIRCAHEVIGSLLPGAELPLVFSNGDYQPGNFLTDGSRITGFLDFESCGFVDPLLGIAKFTVYDIHPLNKGGFVAEFLKVNKFEPMQFDLRVALFAIGALKSSIPIAERTASQERYRSTLFAHVEAALGALR